MKIFGFEIGNTKLTDSPIVTENLLESFVKDAGPTIRPEIKGITIPNAKQPANIVPIKPKVLTYNTDRFRRGEFSEAEYDLSIIGRVEDTDSYVMQAHIKKTGLMFKEGYELVGSNPKTVQYINLRLRQIARATGIPFDELLKSVGAGLIKKSNVVLVKVRKEEASGGARRTVPGSTKQLEPIAGYFVAPAETMLVDADEYGQIRRWKQEMPDGSTREFRPEDVVHFYFNKKEGMIFGTPTLVPVLDDIRALRKIEENIELLVYQHLFPLFHYQVGSDEFPATVDEYGRDEIEVAKREIQYMPAEGGIVTSHRHQISLIGAENRSLRAEGYVDHFKKRVFAGLGISAVDMGEGECYDEHTQTLTENGWKFHWQIDHLNEKIATYNPVTRRTEFHIANYKYEEPYLGTMLHFKNQQIDLMVTPSHDMWVFHNTKHIWEKMTAQEIMDGKAGTVGMFLESAPYLDETSEADWPSYVNSLAGVAGAVVALGSIENNKLYLRSSRFAELQSVFPLLTDIGATWTVHSSKQNKACVEIHALEKLNFFNIESPVALAKKLPLLARKMFVQRIVKHTLYRQKAEIYYGTFFDVRERDQLQELALAAGYSTYTKKVIEDGQEGYRLNVNLRERNLRTRSFDIRTDIKEKQYGGIIYCYNVPNHLFVTRRNGKTTIQGNTANRATSDNMSRNLVDSVKDIQRHVESQFTEFVINELLLESTFGSEVLNPENQVYLKFKEIDLDHQIKKEAHFADQFNKNVVGLNEARVATGRQAIEFPKPEEIESGQDVSDRYPEWHSFQWKLIDEPKTLIQSIDEPYSPAAKAAAASRSTSVTEQQRTEAGQEQTDRDLELEKARVKLKPKSVAKKKDALTRHFNEFQTDTETLIASNRFDFAWFKQIALTAERSMTEELRSHCMAAFADGYRTVNQNREAQINATMRSRSKIESRVNFYVNRLIQTTIKAIDRQNIDVLENSDKIQKVNATFNSLKYRNDFIEDVEVKKARMLGMIEAARDLGFKSFRLIVDKSSCDGCKAAAARSYPIADHLDMEDIPPLHAHSRTSIDFLAE